MERSFLWLRGYRGIHRQTLLGFSLAHIPQLPRRLLITILISKQMRTVAYVCGSKTGRISQIWKKLLPPTLKSVRAAYETKKWTSTRESLQDSQRRRISLKHVRRFFQWSYYYRIALRLTMAFHPATSEQVNNWHGLGSPIRRKVSSRICCLIVKRILHSM